MVFILKITKYTKKKKKQENYVNLLQKKNTYEKMITVVIMRY